MNNKKKYNTGGNLMPTSDFMAQQMSFVNQQQMPQEQEKTIGDRLSNAAKYGALGAKLGTVIPGVGNVVGGLAGAGIGMLMGDGGELKPEKNKGMDGMIKSKIATEAHYSKNPAIKRMLSPTDNEYDFNNGYTGTHYMGSMNNFAVPQIQEINGKLVLGNFGPNSNEAIKFNSEEEAQYFAENYKRFSPALKANGGQINGLANNEPGQLTEFQGGGTHEENPNGGINIGNNNLVEDGETMTDFDVTKFVFSDRIKVPGKNKSFADMSKAIKNKVSKDRPHDKATKRTTERLLAQLADKQEALKAKKEKSLQNKLNDLQGIGMPNESQMSYGGQIGLPKIKILGNGGPRETWESKTGLPWSEARKRGFTTGSYDNNLALLDLLNAQDFDKDKFLNSKNFTVETKSETLPKNDFTVESSSETLPSNFKPTIEDYAKSYTTPTVDDKGNPIDPETGKPLVLKNGKYEVDNTGTEEDYNLRPAYDPYLAAAGTLANIAPSIYNISRGLKKPAEINLQRPQLSKIDLSLQRELIKRQAADTNALNQQNVRNLASSSGSALAGSISSLSSLNKAATNAIAESKLTEDVQNVGITNQQAITNATIANQEQNLRWQTEANRQKALEAGLTGVGLAVASGIKDFRMGEVNNRYNERVLKLLSTSNRRYNPKTGKTEFISYED